MSPILIDEPKIRQLIMLFIIALALAFASGYFLAYQTPPHRLASPIAGDVNNKILPNDNRSDSAKPKAKIKAADKKNMPLKTTAKKSSSQHKKTITKKITPHKKNQPRKNPSVTKKIIKAEKKKKELVVKAVAKKIPPVKKPSITPETKPLINVTKAAMPEQPVDSMLVTHKNDDAQQKTRFSIQVGVFDNQENAQKLVDEIKAKNFDAYISEYVSSKGAAKYNVRFGHFIERAEGRLRLDAFKQHFSLSAYIIINP